MSKLNDILINIQEKLKNKDVTLLTSPGVDTLITEYFLNNFDIGYEKLSRIYFRYNCEYCDQETDIIINRYNENQYKMVNINSYNNFVSSGPEFPARNLLFALNAKIHNMDSDVILFSSFVDDVFYDQTPDFYNKSSEAVSLNTFSNTKVCSLFSDYSRAEVLNIIKNEENFDKTNFLRHSFSCYHPVKKKENIGYYKNFENPISFKTLDAHCHSCNACFRRNVSLLQLGYFIDFQNNDILDSYYKRAAFENKFSEPYKNSILSYCSSCQFFNENRKKFK